MATCEAANDAKTQLLSYPCRDQDIACLFIATSLHSTFGLYLICVRLVLGLKSEILVCCSQKHLTIDRYMSACIPTFLHRELSSLDPELT